MKLAGFLLLLSGWATVSAAVALLREATPRTGFLLAGFAIEMLGLVLVIRSHISQRPERR
jgi:hypothetical protein